MSDFDDMDVDSQDSSLEDEDTKRERLCDKAKELLKGNHKNLPSEDIEDFQWTHEELLYWQKQAIDTVEHMVNNLKQETSYLVWQLTADSKGEEFAIQHKNAYEAELSAIKTKYYIQKGQMPFRLNLAAMGKVSRPSNPKAKEDDSQRALRKHQVQTLGSSSAGMAAELDRNQKIEEKTLLAKYYADELNEVKQQGEKWVNHLKDFMEILRQRNAELDDIEHLLAVNGVTGLNKRLPSPSVKENEWNPLFQPADATSKRALDSSSSEDEVENISYASINDWEKFSKAEQDAVSQELKTPKFPRKTTQWSGLPRLPKQADVGRITALLVHKEEKDGKVFSAIFRLYETGQGIYGKTFFKLIDKQFDRDTKAKLLNLPIGNEISFTPLSLAPDKKPPKKSKTF